MIILSMRAAIAARALIFRQGCFGEKRGSFPLSDFCLNLTPNTLNLPLLIPKCRLNLHRREFVPERDGSL